MQSRITFLLILKIVYLSQMKYLKISLIIFSLSVFISCNIKSSLSGKKNVKQWYKGNLHTHSYWSDGDEFPEMIMDWYKSNGYQFIALTDHNTLAEGDKWIKLKSDSVYQNAFRKYLGIYGSDWVNYKNEAGSIQVKLKTYEEYRKRFEEKEKFLIIQAEEITDRFGNKPLHMNAINIRKKIGPQGGNTVSEILQRNIDEVIKHRKETGIPMFPHINHPNFGYGISLEDMIALRGERFFEVFNGHPMVHNLGDSTHMSTEKMWDLINISYLKNNKPVMYGLATDDSHHYHNKGDKWSNAGRGWIMVQSSSLNPPSLIAAMEAGDFYSTTGVILKKLEFEKKKLLVEVRQQAGISYKIEFIGCKKGSAVPEVFKTVAGARADFIMTDDISYVRSKITSSKRHNNPIEAIFNEMAWTQPVTQNIQ